MTKKILILCALYCLTNATSTYAQDSTSNDTLTQVKLLSDGQKGEFKYYVTEAGNTIGVGDIIKLNQIDGDFYVHVFVFVKGSSGQTINEVNADFAGRELVIQKMATGKKMDKKDKSKVRSEVILTLENPKTHTFYFIQYEKARAASEII